MKSLHKISRQLAIVLTGISLFSCSKSQQEFYPENNVVDIDVKAYIAQDSLQFRLGGNILKPYPEAASPYFGGSVSTRWVANGATSFAVLNSKGELLLERKIDGAAVSNLIKFYYDGATITDKLPDIPKPAAGNVGILLSFPERKYSKVAAKNIGVEVAAKRRGQPTIIKRYTFNDDATVFVDMTFPAGYQYITCSLVKADSPSERYTPDAASYIITLNSPKPDRGYLMMIKEIADQMDRFTGIEGLELTQYLN
ncbi:hypothetical protein ECE50_017555 [Chitinophaga sp. Mgbs1]|uniref:Uncharacterized protein n=1 Tax=Chitinophaga solisilvae TaxID=1233460 RepID=A0A433WL71_9BACT|nr:hypothetical protein [Chitinophaga solisilvae]